MLTIRPLHSGSAYVPVPNSINIHCLHADNIDFEFFSFQIFTCIYLISGDDSPRFSLDSAHAFLFHTPYCKLVQKSFARLLLNDFLRDPNPDFSGRYSGMEAFR